MTLTLTVTDLGLAPRLYTLWRRDALLDSLHGPGISKLSRFPGLVYQAIRIVLTRNIKAQ